MLEREQDEAKLIKSQSHKNYCAQISALIQDYKSKQRLKEEINQDTNKAIMCKI